MASRTSGTFLQVLIYNNAFAGGNSKMGYASAMSWVMLVIILVLYVAASLHCMVRTVAISRELDRAHRVLAMVGSGTHRFSVEGADVVTERRAFGVRLSSRAYLPWRVDQLRKRG